MTNREMLIAAAVAIGLIVAGGFLIFGAYALIAIGGVILTVLLFVNQRDDGE